MKKEWIEIMKKTGRVKLSKWDTLTHYFIDLFLFLPLVFISVDVIKYLITGNYFGVRTPIELILVNIPFIVLGVIFYFIQKNRLNFKIVKTDIAKELIQIAIKTTASELDWRIEINNKDFKVFKTFPKWYSGSWGEQIIVIVDNDRVLVNSICDPDKLASVVSVGRNRKNMNKLINEIQNASC